MSLILSRFIGHVGIALATAIAAWVNSVLLCSTLMRRGHYSPDARIRKRLPRIILSSLVMGAALFAGSYYMRPLFSDGHPLMLRALGLLGLVAVGVLVYFVLAHFTHAMRWAELKKMVRR